MKLKENTIIKRKIIVIGIVFIFALITFFIVRHYFYLLDSYYYTAEFHLLFIKNNLRKGNLELFSEYFSSMKVTEKVFPALLTSYLIQNYWVPFSKPILLESVVYALGLKKGLFLSYISLLLIGTVSFGVGVFFLGDIFPLLKRKVNWLNTEIHKNLYITILITFLFAIPFIVVSIPATISAFIRIPFKQIIIIMITTFVIRMALLFLTQNLFIGEN
ncbi:MAG: hypothetical protein ACPL1G_10075 [Thermodesulfovibrionales bacterium]